MPRAALQSQAFEIVQQVLAPLLSGRTASGRSERFLVVTANGEPRWIVPADHSGSGSVLAGWSPYRCSSLAAWKAVRLAYRLGCLSSLPGVTSVDVAGRDGFDWRSFGLRSNHALVPVIYVGTPGVARKAVIHLVDSASGSCEAIIKTPLGEQAKTAILHEADMLARLSREHCTLAPAVFHVDHVRGISTQAFLKGSPGGRSLKAVHWNLLRSLLLSAETTAFSQHVALWQEQFSRSAGDEQTQEIVSVALGQLCDSRRLPACWLHGDFAPWNIRSTIAGSAALLDWEEAQRGGLPLQDAFHFLHIQDYLFKHRPASHFDSIEPFACTIGIMPEQCRQLEIAYLTSSYLQTAARHELARSEFLRDALRIVLQVKPSDRRRSSSPSLGSAQRLRPASASAWQIRANLFSAFIAHLNAAEIPYCVLSGYRDHPGAITSDVDFMVHPGAMERIPDLLAQAAHSTGGHLVQAIPHETTACYFVLAKEEDGNLGYLDPDCCSDYRVGGRLWLRAESVLARRRRFRNFYVASVSDELAYYLIKKAVKQSITAFQLRRLRRLYQRSRVSCENRMLELWPQATVRAIAKMLIQEDLLRFQSRLAGLLSELKGCFPIEGRADRVTQKLREFRRRFGRVLYPSGMFVLISGGEKGRRSELAAGLLRSLAPTFRLTAEMPLDDAPLPATATHVVRWGEIVQRSRGSLARLTAALQLALGIHVACVRSTLVVATLENRKACLLTKLLRPELLFVLDASPTTAACNAPGSRVVYLSPSAAVDDNVRQASRAILQFMDRRLTHRFRRQRVISYSLPSEPLTEHLNEVRGVVWPVG
jgi:Phosphotransferase enzyme family